MTTKATNVSEGLEDAFRGHNRMDREALDRWRDTAGKGGHDMAPVNLTTLARLIATIDALEAFATLSSPLPSPEVERLRAEAFEEAAKLVDERAAKTEKFTVGLGVSALIEKGSHREALAIAQAIRALSTSLPSPQPHGRVEIRKGEPDYERFNLTLSDEARERLAQKPSAAPIDCVIGGPSPLGVERWQPIETAPKDGTRVLLAYREHVFAGSYREFLRGDLRWLSDGNNVPVRHPSHWMPLPSPPALSALPLLEDRHE